MPPHSPLLTGLGFCVSMTDSWEGESDGLTSCSISFARSGVSVVEEVGWQNVLAKVEVFSRKRVWTLLVQYPVLSGLIAFLYSVKERGTGGKGKILWQSKRAILSTNFIFFLWLLHMLPSSFFICSDIAFVVFNLFCGVTRTISLVSMGSGEVLSLASSCTPLNSDLLRADP